MMEPEITRTTEIEEAATIHEILRGAFEPFRQFYTPKAYAETVSSVVTIKKRILSPEKHVLVGKVGGTIIGTVSYEIKPGRELYFYSMAVDPAFAGNGVGSRLLKEIVDIAMRKRCPAVLLESYEPLKAAISIYERFGFARTGNVRNPSGSTHFEMKKELEYTS